MEPTPLGFPLVNACAITSTSLASSQPGSKRIQSKTGQDSINPWSTRLTWPARIGFASHWILYRNRCMSYRS